MAPELFGHTTALQRTELTRMIRLTAMLQVRICQQRRFHRKLDFERVKKLLGWKANKLTLLPMSQVPSLTSHQPFVHDRRSDRRRVTVVGKLRSRIFSHEQDRLALSKYLRSFDSSAVLWSEHMDECQ